MRSNNKPVIVGLAVVAAVMLACGSRPDVEAGGAGNAAEAATKPETPVTVSMGQKITVNSDGLKATYTLSKPQIKKQDGYIKPQNGAWFLASLRVDVSAGETYTCGCDLSLVEKDGKVNELGIGGIGGHSDFQPTQLKAGQHAEGWVVFDLPEKNIDGSKVQLKITSLFADSAYGYWAVKA
jgi:hypothetical protein